jgi:uncharacterized protein with HEPN domain
MLIKDQDILANMVDAADKIEKYSAGFVNAEDLYNDSKTFDAILMNFIVIGEMAAKLSEEFKNRNPEIEWWKIKGLRNIVAHDYFGVDAEEIWQIIHNKISGLKLFIQKKIN